MEKNFVKVFLLDITPLNFINFEQITAKLPLHFIQRVKGYKDDNGLILSLGGYLLLDYALNLLKIKDRTLKINENGKPHLENEGVYFSISHSGTIP